MAEVLRLAVLPGRLAVCRLPADAVVATEPGSGPLWSLTRSGDELSLVVSEEEAPAGARVEAGWRALRVAGPLDFALTGVMASLAHPLAAAGVSLFAVSTFDTDYLLVKEAQLSEAVEALRRAGHRVEG